MRTAAVDDWEGGAVVGRKAGRMGQRGDKFNARLIVQSGVEERGLMLTGPCGRAGSVITPTRFRLVEAMWLLTRGVNTRFSSTASSMRGRARTLAIEHRRRRRKEIPIGEAARGSYLWAKPQAEEPRLTPVLAIGDGDCDGRFVEARSMAVRSRGRPGEGEGRRGARPGLVRH